MLARLALAARIKRLEAQSQASDEPQGQGLAALLAYARAHHIEAVPLDALTDTELDAKIAALPGQPGLAPLLLEIYEAERARRQGHV